MLELYLPLWANILIFLGAAGVIGFAGTRLAGLADRLADRTGLGEAFTGAVFLGLATALPGIAASVTAALGGNPALAISNAFGGIAVQTAFLAVADIAYRKANLEHAAASVSNMMQTAVLVLLIALVLLTLSGPEVEVIGIHPMTPLLFFTAAFGLRLVYRTGEEPMWKPERTSATVEDVPEESAEKESLRALLRGFIVGALLVLAAGAAVAEAASGIARDTDLSASVVGGLFMAVATSLPELVTTVAAVRRGALTLAVSDIVGGNVFDILFVAAADIAYLGGSIYHAEGVTRREVFLGGLTLLLNVVLLMGLIYRQRRGPANIGFESLLMLILYVAGFLVLSLMM